MLQPAQTLYARGGMVCSPDHLASEAGVAMLRAGGNAVDAAIAAGAVLTVTFQGRNGLGGDLLAVICPPGEDPIALNSSGFAGAGADAAALRAEGHTKMPARGDVRVVTVPGCVDGWCALHARFGRLPLASVLAPAIALAADGFPASPCLVRDLPAVAHVPESVDFSEDGTLALGQLVRRPGVARLLEVVVGEGRDGYYGGEFGKSLLEIGQGLFEPSDLTRPIAEWFPALSLDAYGHRLWTIPPASCGYLTLSSAWLASEFGLPEDPDDPAWAHLLIEASRQASYDRLDVLHEHADGAALLDRARLSPRLAAIDPERAALLPDSYAKGGTIGLVAVDDERLGVSLMQSNAWGFGSHLALAGPRVFLHNRGIGFSLVEGHPNEFRPGAKPVHTLSPAAVTSPAGDLVGVTASMGGDSQPQILLQAISRWLGNHERPGDVLAAGRFILADPGDGGPFDTWQQHGRVRVLLEGQAPEWDAGLAARGHLVERRPEFSDQFGHAHLIALEGEVLAGGTDPRSGSGAVAGY